MLHFQLILATFLAYLFNQEEVNLLLFRAQYMAISLESNYSNAVEIHKSLTHTQISNIVIIFYFVNAVSLMLEKTVKQ